MNLAAFLKYRSIPLAAFARQIGVSTETVRRYRNGTRLPERDIIVRIFEATDGLVTPNDFYGIGPVPLQPVEG